MRTTGVEVLEASATGDEDAWGPPLTVGDGELFARPLSEGSSCVLCGLVAGGATEDWVEGGGPVVGCVEMEASNDDHEGPVLSLFPKLRFTAPAGSGAARDCVGS